MGFLSPVFIPFFSPGERTHSGISTSSKEKKRDPMSLIRERSLFLLRGFQVQDVIKKTSIVCVCVCAMGAIVCYINTMLFRLLCVPSVLAHSYDIWMRHNYSFTIIV